MDAAAGAGHPGGMDFEQPSQDPDAGRLVPADGELVARTLRDLRARTESDVEVLLSAMLTAAWPAPRSQLQ
jgi:hypothetical protein